MFSGAKMSHFWQQPSQNQTYYIPDIMTKSKSRPVDTKWRNWTQPQSPHTWKNCPTFQSCKYQHSNSLTTTIFCIFALHRWGCLSGDCIFTSAFELQQNKKVQQWSAKTCRSSWDVKQINHILVEVVLLYVHCAHSLLLNAFCNANLFYKKEINTAKRLSGELRWHSHELWINHMFQ